MMAVMEQAREEIIATLRARIDAVHGAAREIRGWGARLCGSVWAGPTSASCACRALGRARSLGNKDAQPAGLTAAT